MADQHTIVALVQDKPGVLNRISSLFRRRGFNIASLAVGQSEQPNLSRMTFVVEGDEDTVEQCTKQLNKLIEVLKVSDYKNEEVVLRELARIRVHATASTRGEIMQLVNIFGADILDVSQTSLIIEAAGDEERINSLFNLLRPFGIREVMRTGRIAMSRSVMTNGRGGSPQSQTTDGGESGDGQLREDAE